MRTAKPFVKKIKKNRTGKYSLLYSVGDSLQTAAYATRFSILRCLLVEQSLYQQIAKRWDLPIRLYSYLRFTSKRNVLRLYRHNVDNIEKAVIAVRKEINNVKKCGLTNEEFIAARQ